MNVSEGAFREQTVLLIQGNTMIRHIGTAKASELNIS